MTLVWKLLPAYDPATPDFEVAPDHDIVLPEHRKTSEGTSIHKNSPRENAMNRIVIVTVTALIIGIVSPVAAVAETAKDFVGTWTLVSAITEQDGNKSDTFGANAKGVLMFDANGHYMITFIGANLPKFASSNRGTGTADENKAVVGGSLAHFGTYVVNEADKNFTYRIESATFPNWDHTEQKRSFTIAGDELKYTVASASAGGTATVIWKRVK
jgi:hypothetical protein